MIRRPIKWIQRWNRGKSSRLNVFPGIITIFAVYWYQQIMRYWGKGLWVTRFYLYFQINVNIVFNHVSANVKSLKIMRLWLVGSFIETALFVTRLKYRKYLKMAIKSKIFVCYKLRVRKRLDGSISNNLRLRYFV